LKFKENWFSIRARRPALAFLLAENITPADNTNALRPHGVMPPNWGDPLPWPLKTSEQAAAISQRWRGARERWKNTLQKMEGEANFDGLQRFPAYVHALAAENRLPRFV
jgi:hypothetical protein